MKVFCAACGLPLSMSRKALPKLGVIIELVNYHECAKEPVPFDINALAPKPIEGKNSFSQALNTLDISKPSAPAPSRPEGERARGFVGVGTDNLRDRRFGNEEGAKSTAPNSISEQIRLMSNSIPAKELREVPEGLRKDDMDSVEMGD